MRPPIPSSASLRCARASIGRRRAELTGRAMKGRPRSCGADAGMPAPFYPNREDGGLVSLEWRAQINRLEDECKRNHQGSDDGQGPEYVDVGKEIDLPLQGLPYPGQRLRCGFRCV